MSKGKYTRFNTTRRIVLGFILIIVLGAAILMMPFSQTSGRWGDPVDSFFTAFTSVCVTGLTTVTIADTYTLIGKIIILGLIQLGGLGVICITIAVLMLFRKKISLKQRTIVQEAYGFSTVVEGFFIKDNKKKHLVGYGGIVRRIVKGTFIVEGMGAVLYSIRFVQQYGVLRGIWYGVFHSVSAFCNAGIDILGDSSLCNYSTDVLVNLTTIFLIVVGGIGFIVWWDIMRVIKGAIKARKMKNMLFKRLSLHSKLAITTTLTLITVSTVLIFIFEYTNPQTMAGHSLGERFIMSFFEAVTPRTAGFASVAQQNFRSTTTLLTLILMIIGGSPMGTAGGIKTTTLAMLFNAVLSTVKGKKDVECFHRKISDENIRTGLSIATITMGILISSTLIISVIEPFSMKEIIFETFSAMGTVGLTLGITSKLSVFSKILIMLVMYAGRIGPITMAMAFSNKKKSVDGVELPEKKIIVG